MGEMLDLDKMTGIPARLKKQTWQPWTSAFQCTNKRSWPRGCLSRNHKNNQMSHALVAYFIVHVSSTYALESESGKREVFIYSDSHFVVGLVFSLDSFKKKRRDASWGGEVHCVTHAPSSSTSNGFHWKKWSNIARWVTTFFTLNSCDEDVHVLTVGHMLVSKGILRSTSWAHWWQDKGRSQFVWWDLWLHIVLKDRTICITN